MEFVHLHNHTEYSLLDGLLRINTKPGSFLPRIASEGVKAMAITDHGNMYGAVDFYFACKKVGIKPIVGCEVYVAKDHKIKDKTAGKPYHLTLLAKDYDGYKNLMKLVSKAWVDGFYYHPRIDKEILAAHSGGLIALSGCLQGELSRECLGGTIESAVKTAKEYEDIMGKGNYYIELMDHGITDEQVAQKMLLEVSKRSAIPVVATNDCHYDRQEDWQIHEIHMCISTGKTLQDENRMKMDQHELYFKSAEEMYNLFSHSPEACKNTLEIAEKCNIEMPKTGFILPHFDVPSEFTSIDNFLKAKCLDGLKHKLGGEIPQNYMDRLEYELGVIGKMGFASYFLIVADFIGYANEHNIPVGPGRGSGAGSMVAYSLNITKVDPIVNGLLFERFLNPDRLTMPDLDIDFSDAGREQVIEYVRNKYGNTNVAQIITFGSMKAKLALKDVARVMGISVAESNRITKLIPNDLGTTIESAIEQNKDLQRELKENKQTKDLFDYAKKLEGIKRHSGIHAAGIVVTREEVFNYSPLARGSKESITTQYEGETLVNLGLLKIDFLGLRTLSVIDNTIKLVEQTQGIKIDIDNIPLDDKKTYDLLASAHTLCIFQLESSGMRDLVKRLEPSQFSDISALVALYRPGPMQSGMLDMFVNRKSGKEKVKYDHPILEPILKETYGTMVYQEQIMEISKAMGGFTPGEADSLRKAMGKKKVDEMEKARENFVKGAAEKGVKDALSTKIFNQMAEFAGYGFNKSHSVAYALVSYQTAYLKANYPIEFMCAALINEIGHNAIGSEDKENKIITYIDEAKRLGFETLPPDVNKSEALFSVEKDEGKRYIRFGLEALKNMGTETAENIVKARKEGGPYKSLEDLIERLDSQSANKRVIESLIKSGALDSLTPDIPPEESRAQYLAEMEEMLSSISKIKAEKENMAGGLFGMEELESTLTFKKSDIKAHKARPLTKAEMLESEKEMLGFYLSGHPLSKYYKFIPQFGAVKINDIKEKGITGPVTILGIVTRVKKRFNKNNEEWAQFVIEDETGSIAVNAFSKVYAKVSDRIVPNAIIVLKGDIRAEEGFSLTVFTTDILSVAGVVSALAKKLIIKIPQGYSKENLQILSALLGRTQGITEVILEIEHAFGVNKVRVNSRITVHNPLLMHIETTISPDAWDFSR
ncbi:DNA polymerase-3 subunit alpha [Parelusimicrobium proximum]|uniref:DNA polymerase III subunit alpha n=1 Tax=Parelusimicrobium proximum TaxID=3228953 RepID=UPI003D185DE9